ncbi:MULTISPECIES: hypothetical protein [Methylomonas]|uniref:hypothetical protein n=1 Tax=Methylomonas TaxID=416 RepID=UPI0018D3DC0E|nr:MULTISPECIES: hypothetical protein [Methylomonas]WGS85781.1 hypothetical protein QC632_22530 [Methylomonas sp. UP202]
MQESVFVKLDIERDETPLGEQAGRAKSFSEAASLAIASAYPRDLYCSPAWPGCLGSSGSPVPDYLPSDKSYPVSIDTISHTYTINRYHIQGVFHDSLSSRMGAAIGRYHRLAAR